MASVEEIFDQKHASILIDVVNKKRYSKSVKKKYDLCIRNGLNPNNFSLHDFAAYANGNEANRHGIGELSQIDYLQIKYPNLEKLPNKGPQSVNIDKIKSIDAIDKSGKIVYLFMLKTIDIGTHSKNIGGSAQRKTEKEIEDTINIINNLKFAYDGKPAKFMIGINGRSAAKIIKKYSKLNSPNIVINNCENL
jgi:hypothetical protein